MLGELLICVWRADVVSMSKSLLSCKVKALLYSPLPQSAPDAHLSKQLPHEVDPDMAKMLAAATKASTKLRAATPPTRLACRPRPQTKPT